MGELQALLGHVDLSTTGRYLRMAGSELQQAARAASVLRVVRLRLKEAKKELMEPLASPAEAPWTPRSRRTLGVDKSEPRAMPVVSPWLFD